MTDFQRARSDAQKAQRMNQIKEVAERQFSERSYHEITLTTIADELGWCRANLYKYACSKEEIFLDITADKRAAYYDALKASFPEGCGFSPQIIAEVWSGIANCHREFFRYSSLLPAILETNASVERIAAFKRDYYDRVLPLRQQLGIVCGMPTASASRVISLVEHEAQAICTHCQDNPIVRDAMALIGREVHDIDLRETLRDFIAMCLDWYRR